jgi:hypothetical protein
MPTGKFKIARKVWGRRRLLAVCNCNTALHCTANTTIIAAPEIGDVEFSTCCWSPSQHSTHCFLFLRSATTSAFQIHCKAAARCWLLKGESAAEVWLRCASVPDRAFSTPVGLRREFWGVESQRECGRIWCLASRATRRLLIVWAKSHLHLGCNRVLRRVAECCLGVCDCDGMCAVQ